MIGRAMKMPTRPTSLRVSEAPRRRAESSQLRRGVLGLSPAVTEGGVVFDFSEFGIDEAELVSNALDRRTDIGSVAILSAPGDEADVVHAIVHRAIGHVAADIESQQAHDVEL